MIIHVVGPAAGAPTASCFLRLTSHVAAGGTATYCLTTFRGAPGPHATVHVGGTLTLRLPHRTVHARVLIVDRFGADGVHATQALTGTLEGGGRIHGGGTFSEPAPGRISRSDLTYELTLRR